MRKTMTLAKLTAVAAASLLLSGCLSLGGKTPASLLALTPTSVAPVGKTVSGTITNAIVVLDPETDRSLDVLRVPVRVNASTIAYLKDIGWIEKPARQFRSLLAETLRAKTDRLVVEGGDFEVTGKTLIGGRLLDMGYDAASQSVVVRFDAMKTEKGGEMISRRFQATVPGVAPKAEAVAPAMNQAANEVATQVADWVAGG